MIQTIRVQTVVGPDLLGEGVLSRIYQTLGKRNIKKVETVKVYRLEGIDKQEAKLMAEKLFCETINQKYTLNKPIIKGVYKGGALINSTSRVVEIAYKPGVMNPEVGSVLKSAKDLGIKVSAADTSYEYGFYGSLKKDDEQEIVKKLNLFNPLVEEIVKKPRKTLSIKGVRGKITITPIRKLSDEELMQLSQDKLFLNLEEMKVIQKYFQKIKRDPTDCEVETLAQTWSEHSGHKTFRAKIILDGKEKEPLITRIKKEALKHRKHIVSAFVDNAGVMDFYDGWAINGKAETHNSPSAIEPYGGAMTGSGGVFRDIVATGRGAKTVVSTDIFCLGPWDYPIEKLPPGTLPPGYILKRVIDAVRDYGNRMGIPTNNGSLHFHEDFRAKPTVLVGAYGILPKKYARKGTPKVDDVVVSIGGRIGRDGIHGATFSSGEMTDRTINVNAQAVQIGNAIEEKRTFDAIIEARDMGLIRAIQDSGGGGLSSAVGELGAEIGVKVDLENERLKYHGLSPWEIWLSESQERMVIAIAKDKLKMFQKICKKYNVEVSVLGKLDGSKKLKVFYGKEMVCNLDMKFLHNGLPQRIMKATKPAGPAKNRAEVVGSPRSKTEWVSILKKVLSHGNVCSKEPILRLYDHTVQGTSVLPPYVGVQMDGPTDATVIRPLLDKKYGMVVSHGLNPVLNNLDPYWGSMWAGVEAISNYVAVGGNYKETSLINNYIWPFPDEESLWSLDRSVDAVVDFMKLLKIPVISGKDSLSSTYRGKDGSVIKIPPVLCMSVFGRIPDVTKTVSSDFKKEGSTIVLVGKHDLEGMGGSIYYDVHNILGDRIPKVDLKQLPKTLDTIYKGIRTGKIIACHDVSEGGLLTALFEMCVGGGMGAVISAPKRYAANYLFNETTGCFIVEVASKQAAQKLFGKIPHVILGKTTNVKTINVKNMFSAEIHMLKKVWQRPMKEIFS